MIQFTPLRLFHSEEMRSTYVPGQTYTLRPDNERLRIALEEWVRDGRVQLVINGSRIVGRGKVSG